MTGPDGRSRPGRLRAVLGPLLVTVGLLAACELGLRLAGFRAPVSVGGQPPLDALPLFHPGTDEHGTPVMQRNDAPVFFRSTKPANGLRVFVIGESSVWGFPFGPEFAFARFLQERLQAGMPGRTVEVVNAGIAGIGSWHARQVAEEVAAYRPDVVVVYLGHNELTRKGPNEAPPGRLARWVSQSRFYQLAVVGAQAWQRWRHGPIDAPRVRGEFDAFKSLGERARGQVTLTAADRQRMADRYAENLRAIVATAQAAGARVVLVALAQNVRDLPPGASRHRCGLSDDERNRWRAAIVAADAKLRAGEAAGALDDLRTAEHIDARPAILHYLRGQSLEALGRFDEARAAYWRASDQDEIPLGAPSQLNQIVRAVADETGAQFVDLPEALARESVHGLPGDALFLDSIHPTVAGHVAIAGVLAGAFGVDDRVDGTTDVAALLAAHPEIQEKIYRNNTALDLILGWHDRALAELNKAGDQFPQLLAVRQNVEDFRKVDPVRSWDDVPDACDAPTPPPR